VDFNPGIDRSRLRDVEYLRACARNWASSLHGRWPRKLQIEIFEQTPKRA